jgi:multiple sugar transport system permease protein
MIPDTLRLVPIYLMLVNWIPAWVGHLGWHDATFINRNGVILIQLVSAASLFLMRQYFLTIPRDLEEAAKLDGAGYFKTYRKVMLPLAGPALAAVGILTFQGAWNGLFWPAILLQDKSQYTIPIGIANFRFAYTTLWPPLMAASVLAILPILLLFIVFQRYFVAGVAASGVKG